MSKKDEDMIKEEGEKNTTSSHETEEIHQYGEAETDEQIVNLQKQIDEEKDKNLRLYAEFENFRRRSAKERLELISSASSDVIRLLLPIVDDFDRAVESNKEAKDIDSLKEGFELLRNKMKKALEAQGVKAMTVVGEPFDAEVHEAIAQVEVEDPKKKGVIIDEAEKGYMLNEKIIRHPKVVVGS